ncbi:cysteine proteinase [Testicularia cyperi]|uniref:ubiquitinyl hydrolase 1 n=1 Tax=Testicularia cyperi TaxID=1882483 RepID=A0A317XLE7_9BASI|nr:cysteine proteinase [Testicularia cyperi]
MEGVDHNTALESLSDAQRLELAEKLKAESSAGQPLISSVEPIEVLQKEYANNDAFLGKINWLKEQAGFIGIRRAKGDGDCFYRAFAFAFIYKIMTIKDRPMHHFTVKHVESTLQLLKQAGFDEEVYTDFYEPLKQLMSRMYSTDPETKELNEQALLEAMNDPEQSNSIVVYLRLLTSACLKLNADEYTPFLFSLDSASTDAGPPDMATFCSNQVEAIGKEADHVQITALSRALKVSLDVAYLSPNQAPPETPLDEDFPAEQIQHSTDNDSSSQAKQSSDVSNTAASSSIAVPGAEAEKRRAAAEHPDRCDIVRFEVEGGQITEIGTMLLRPGHYDLLVQAPAPASPEPEIPAILST